MASNYVALLITALVVVNLWTVFCFWLDKRRAVTGERRISEGDLIGLAIFGGSPGALLARHLFRHKTRKEPFSTQLLIVVALQVGAIIGFIVAF